jgi:hypothetical protein
MYPQYSIHSQINHSKETLVSARDVGFPARMNIRKKMGRAGHHRVSVMS